MVMTTMTMSTMILIDINDIAEKKAFEKERKEKFHSAFKSVSLSVSVDILHSNGHLEVD